VLEDVRRKVELGRKVISYVENWSAGKNVESTDEKGGEIEWNVGLELERRLDCRKLRFRAVRRWAERKVES
jgi:hypothetical protein